MTRETHSLETLRRPRWWLGSLMLMAGCTILQPIQTPTDDRRFPLPVKQPGDVGAPCVNPGLEGVECRPLPQDLAKFYGDLPRAMWEMDERRRELVGQAAQHTNLNSAYNALLWPLGAFFVAKKLRHPEWSVRDLAAVGIGSYGLLNSGIQDRDKLYLRTAEQMACALAVADGELYRKYEISGSTQDAGAGTQCTDTASGTYCNADSLDRGSVQPPLNYVTENLHTRLHNYRVKLERIWPQLRLKPLPPQESRNTVDQRRDQLLGRGQGAGTKDPLPDLRTYLFGKIRVAERLLEDLAAQQDSLRDAGARLRARRSHLEAALAKALNDRTPALQQPQDVAAQVLQAMQMQQAAAERAAGNVPGGATAQGEQRKKGTAQDYRPDARALDALKDDKLLSELLRHQGPALEGAMAEARRWQQRHEQRMRRAQEGAQALGCTTLTVGQFAAALAARPAASAASASLLP